MFERVMPGLSCAIVAAVSGLAAAGTPIVHEHEALVGIASSCSADVTLLPGALTPGDTTDAWAAPASYYSAVSGTGTALKSSLTSAMSIGHIQRSYGDFRNSARFHDTDPANSSRILLVYNRASVSGNWDSGSTWNREHVWPQSRQPGSASNSSRGNLGDPHALRPCNPSINSSRGNKPFGFETTTGGFGSLGSYYFPGDTDKGDIARSLFYSATRYSSSGLSLTNSFPSGNQMGELDALLAWHYLDLPDEFERRRNHVIYSQSLNPSYYTGNRSAFVDLPGAAWSVFRDNLNDSKLWFGGAAGADGSSQVDFCVRAIEGTPPPAGQVTLSRDGVDGVYYAVHATGDAVSDQPLQNGFTGAFAIGETTARSIEVGIDPAAVNGPGLYTGTVTLDNLDMTTGFGNGFGALDADDTVELSFESLAASSASFAPGSVQLATSIDLGSVAIGETVQQSVSVYALESVAGFTAGSSITLDGTTGSGGTLIVTPPAGVLEAGLSGSVLVSFTGGVAGAASFSVSLDTADDPAVVGALARAGLTLNVSATVGDNCDLTGDGTLNIFDVLLFLERFEQEDPSTDLIPDGMFNVFDVLEYLTFFDTGC